MPAAPVKPIPNRKSAAGSETVLRCCVLKILWVTARATLGPTVKKMMAAIASTAAFGSIVNTFIEVSLGKRKRVMERDFQNCKLVLRPLGDQRQALLSDRGRLARPLDIDECRVIGMSLEIPIPRGRARATAVRQKSLPLRIKGY
jgi:hypothetical protein